VKKESCSPTHEFALLTSYEIREHMRDINVVSWYSRSSHQSNTLAVSCPSVDGITDLPSLFHKFLLPFIHRAIYCLLVVVGYLWIDVVGEFSNWRAWDIKYT